MAKLRIQVTVAKVTGSLKTYEPKSTSQDISFYDMLNRLIMHYLKSGLFHDKETEDKKKQMRRGHLFRF